MCGAIIGSIIGLIFLIMVMVWCYKRFLRGSSTRYTTYDDDDDNDDNKPYVVETVTHVSNPNGNLPVASATVVVNDGFPNGASLPVANATAL